MSAHQRSQPAGAAAPLKKRPAPGVRIIGAGCYAPERRLTNADFERTLDTSDEWIVQRTGIRERRQCDRSKGESNRTMCIGAMKSALRDAHIEPEELDLIIVASCTGESTVPALACRVAHAIGAGDAGAFDITAACSGYVYALNIAHELIKGGAYRTIGVIGSDEMSSILDYTNRSVCILFGDIAGAAILRTSDDPTKGLLAQTMHADGSSWADLHLPRRVEDIPQGVEPDSVKLGALQMNGRAIYKFAVTTFGDLIQETLDDAGVSVDEVDHFICHQSNARILESIRKRFSIPQEKMFMNIEMFGNCSSGSTASCFAQLSETGQIKDGQLVMFVAFGAGLTWASGLWRV